MKLLRLQSGGTSILAVTSASPKKLIAVSDVSLNLPRSTNWQSKLGSSAATDTNGTIVGMHNKSVSVFNACINAINNAAWVNKTSTTTPGAYLTTSHRHSQKPPLPSNLTVPMYSAEAMTCLCTYTNINTAEGIRLRYDWVRLSFAACGLLNFDVWYSYTQGNWVSHNTILVGMEADEINVQLMIEVTVGARSYVTSISAAVIAAGNITAGNTSSFDALYRRKYNGWVTTGVMVELTNMLNLDTVSPISLRMWWSWDYCKAYASCGICNRGAPEIGHSLTTKTYTAQQPTFFCGVSAL